VRKYEYQSEFARKYFAEGRKEGRLEGQLDPLVHLFERRLGRPLTSEEHERLGARLRDNGADRLTDIALDHAPDDLATWLAATNGH